MENAARRGTVLIGLIWALVVSQGSCVAPHNTITEPPTMIVPVVGVRVSPQVILLSAIGETRQLSATISPANASDRTIIWETTDSLVASVDSLGRVTAKGVGVGVFVTAYAHDRQHQASVNVSVVISADATNR
jgi:uncharacterized protein YjdB